MPNEADATLTGFLSAEYGFDTGNGELLHIGDALTAAPSRCWITAWNPLGQIASGAANAAAQTLLRTQADATGLAYSGGFARAPADSSHASWNEPCFVIDAAPLNFIDRLAHAHRQLAVVIAEPGIPARLRCYRRFWQERFGQSDMDAANVEWVA